MQNISLQKLEPFVWGSLLILYGVAFYTISAFSAQLLVVSDHMSTLGPGIGANHEIRFITVSGASENTDAIELSFDSGFDLSAINNTDIDLSFGPTGTETFPTLNTFAGSSTWGAQVIGNSIFLTHPTTNGSVDIQPGDRIIIKIGTNAVGGTDQILNPSTYGSKIIEIKGSFGDTGSLAVPISNNTIGVGGRINDPDAPTGGVTPIEPVSPPVINFDGCPVIFSDQYLLNGEYVIGTDIVINGINTGISYTTNGTWSSQRLVQVGENQFVIYATDPTTGVNSDPIVITIQRNPKGDNTSDLQVNDFDLAGLAAHWDQDWCPSDFNNDGIIDDFDLSTISWHWDA